jgi:hypothetical protein
LSIPFSRTRKKGFNVKKGLRNKIKIGFKISFLDAANFIFSG